ncbi:hypothetical protein SNE40_018865 [Patella caerulea]|uniref:PiggyBac transposable element-derived protein domain-containing protein n=1 Tax=Patella caerulea TaxID=87958 RepID=A0AAN8J8D5_PATCE
MYGKVQGTMYYDTVYCMKSKPIKWGLKGWVLAGAKTNYVHQWRLYVGKEDNVRTENLGYQVVNDISSDMVPGQELYCDSLYTSVKLFQELQSKNIGACGTTQSNRKGNPKDLRPFNKKTTKRRLDELSPVFRYHDGLYLMAVG